MTIIIMSMCFYPEVALIARDGASQAPLLERNIIAYKLNVKG